MRLFSTFITNSYHDRAYNYVCGTFGAMQTYTYAQNPIIGMIAILTDTASELIDLYMRPEISEQEIRVSEYSRAFESLKKLAKTYDSPCTSEEINNAKNIFFVHNLIEEFCYKALPDIVVKLGITGDKITPEQSSQILAHLKSQAHVELRKEGGYSRKGRQMISEDQFAKVLQNISTVIHDRDTRLTDARYSSLTDLCAALDDHNSYIKNLLFKSWFRCNEMHSDTHLPMIKKMVNFNQRMSATVGFNFGDALEKKKAYFDSKHGEIRQIQCKSSGEYTAQNFVNLSEVRGLFSPEIVSALQKTPAEQPLFDHLRQFFSNSEIKHMTCPSRTVNCAPRHGKPIQQPQLLDPSLTVGQFLKKYFPESLNEEKESASLTRGVATS